VDIVEAHGRVVANFALAHFRAAKRLAAEVDRVQSAHLGQPFGEFFEEIQMYCAGCIIVAVASLEALINELYITPGPLRNSVQDFERVFWGGERRRCLVLFWRPHVTSGLERKPAVEKYKKALKYLNKPSLPQPSTTDAWALIGFRNYLIHFKPLWDDQRAKDTQDDLEQRLRGLFTGSPFVDAGSDFLAKHCMSSGCANWAVNTVVRFVKEFGEKSGLNPEKLISFK
jgi:hypothetical protein